MRLLYCYTTFLCFYFIVFRFSKVGFSIGCQIFLAQASEDIEMVNSFSLFFLSLHSQHPPYLHISFDKCVNTCHGSRIVRGGCNTVFLPLPNLFRKPRPISFKYKSTIGATSSIRVVALYICVQRIAHIQKIVIYCFSPLILTTLCL